MSDCCNNKACDIEALRNRQGSILKIVLAINAVMFLIELTAGLIAGSVSLLADSLDMLGDTLVYGFSIYVIAGTPKMKAHVALLKGGVMAAFGFFVLAQVVYKIIFPQVPVFETIGAIGLLALAANSICFALLWHHRTDDINMSSIWLCSRNDVIANIAVLVAAAGVWFTHAGWPDIVVGLALSALFLQSALFVLRGAMAELRVINTAGSG